MTLLTRLFAALSLSLLVATTTTAHEPEPASANRSGLSEIKKKRLPGSGPYIYRGCITLFGDYWVEVLPFRSTHSTAEELMSNQSNLRDCVKA